MVVATMVPVPRRVYPKRPTPKSLTEFIALHDGLVTSWVRAYGFKGTELDDAKQDIYTTFLKKRVVEVFDPSIPKFADFLGYIRIKVNRILSSKYRKHRRQSEVFGSLTRVDSEGEEQEVEVEDKAFIRKDELGRWWQDHITLLDDPTVRVPVVVKVVGGVAYIITPMLVLNMVLMGYVGEDIMKSLRLSRVCFNRIRNAIREKLGSTIYWADGGE